MKSHSKPERKVCTIKLRIQFLKWTLKLQKQLLGGKLFCAVANHSMYLSFAEKYLSENNFSNVYKTKSKLHLIINPIEFEYNSVTLIVEVVSCLVTFGKNERRYRL